MAASEASILESLDSARLARCVFDTSSDSIFVFNAQGNEILDANTAAVDRTGRTRAELLQLRITDCLEMAEPGQGRLIPAVGAPVDVHVSITLVSHGSVPVAVAVLRDVPPRRNHGLPDQEMEHRASGREEVPEVPERPASPHDAGAVAENDHQAPDHPDLQSTAFGTLLPAGLPADGHAAHEANGRTHGRFLFAIENIHEALFVYDEHDALVDVNESACQRLGYTREELLARKMSDIDPLSVGPNRMNRWQALKAEGRTLFQSRHLRKDGTEFPVEVSAVHFLYGSRAFVCALVKDISQRRIGEQERDLRLWHLQTMDGVNAVLAGAEEIQPMLDALMEILLESIGCDRAYAVFTGDPGANEVSIRAERTAPEFPGALAAGESVLMDSQMERVFRRILESSEPVDFQGQSVSEVIGRESAERYRVQSMMCQAMRPRIGNAWMLGVHQCSHVRLWTDAERRLISEVSRRVEDRLSTLLIQEDLRRSQATLARAQQIARVGNWQRDLTTGITTGSAEFLRIPGQPPDERAAFFERFLEDAVHPEDQAMRSAAHAEFLATGQTRPLEYRVRLSGNPTVRYVREESELIPDQNGNPKLLVGTIQDVTGQKLTEVALRESEAKFRVLTENSPALVLIARGARVVYCNEAVAVATGYSRAELSIQDFLELIHPDDRELVAERHRARLAGRNPPSRYEIAMLHKSGGIRWLEISTSLIQYAGSAAVLVVGIDRTEQRAAEDQLRERENQIAHFSRLSTMGEMVAGIAHEIGQPLSAIANFAMACDNTLKADDHSADAPIRDWLKQIGEQAFRCGDIIRSMRQFAKKNDGERVPVSLHTVIRDSVLLIKSTKRIPHANISTEFSGDSPRLLANEVQLQQVLVNLLCNAGDATRECERPMIRIRVDQVGEQARMIIADNGPGIDPQLRVRLFEPFFTTKADGLGMGLAISKSIVEAHGGNIRIDGQKEEGASFVVELPLGESPPVQ